VSAAPRVIAPETPLYQFSPHLCGPLIVRDRRPSKVTLAPRTPFRELSYHELAGLGATPGAIVAASAPIAAASASAIASATAAGSFAGPIGAGVGLVVGLIGGLLAGHELRAKQAKNENSAVNIAVSGFDSDLKQVWQAYKAGQISATDAANAIEQGVMPGYWTVVGPQIQPGRNGCSNGMSCPVETPGKQPCVGSIGAGCCVACYQLEPGITGPNGVLAALQGASGSTQGPYVAEIPKVSGSSYGTSNRGAYTLDFTPPASSSTGLTSALSSMTVGGSSLMPLLLLGAAVWLVMR
jgi:hypothetical protein